MRIHSGDAEISYEVIGAGPPVVLLHPFPAHRGIWTSVAEALVPRYRCILPDLRGHGESGPGTGPATMEKHAADVMRVCDHAGVGRAVFAGVSIGGYVLFEVWRQHRERIAALVLCDTRAQADTDEGRRARLQTAEDVQKHGPAAFVNTMTERLLGATTQRNRPDIVAAARAMMGKMPVAGIVAVQQGMAARFDSVPMLKTIDVPTLVLVGDEDITTPAADSELMQRNITGSRMEIIPAAGHYGVFEQSEFAARALRQFLDGLLRW